MEDALELLARKAGRENREAWDMLKKKYKLEDEEGMSYNYSRGEITLKNDRRKK